MGIEQAGGIDADQGESGWKGVGSAADIDDIRVEWIDGQALMVVAWGGFAAWSTRENIDCRSQVVIGRYLGFKGGSRSIDNRNGDLSPVLPEVLGKVQAVEIAACARDDRIDPAL